MCGAIMSDGNDLYTMVGEIRSDVKKLLKNDTDQDNRIGAIEKKLWVASGTAGILAMLVGPAVAKMFGL